MESCEGAQADQLARTCNFTLDRRAHLLAPTTK